MRRSRSCARRRATRRQAGRGRPGHHRSGLDDQAVDADAATVDVELAGGESDVLAQHSPEYATSRMLQFAPPQLRLLGRDAGQGVDGLDGRDLDLGDRRRKRGSPARAANDARSRSPILERS
jgi:hypothetical protein